MKITINQEMGIKIIESGNLSCQLDRGGITFWNGEVIAFDCPIGRINKEPRMALEAIDLIFKMIQDNANASDITIYNRIEEDIVKEEEGEIDETF